MGFLSKITRIMLFVLFSSVALADEIAVMPYLVETTEVSAGNSLDVEYAGLLGIAAAVEYGLDFYSMDNLKKDLKNIGIDYHSILTADDLRLLARRRMLKYIATGTIYKTSSGYTVKTVLYDSKTDQIVARSSVSGRTLFDTVKKDLHDIFRYMPTAKTDSKTVIAESVLLLDCSYNMINEKVALVDSLKKHYETIFRQYPGSKVYCLAFNSQMKSETRSFFTSGALNSYLDNIKFNASNNDKSIRSALDSAVSNIKFQNGSLRYIVFPFNSNMKNISYFTRFANQVAARRAAVYPVVGAKVDISNNAALTSLAERTGGKFYPLLYHQVFFDRKAESFHLFMRSGRLYFSELPYPQWNSEFKSGEVKQQFDVPTWLNPYNLEKYYRDGLKRVIVKSNPLEVNSRFVFADIIDRFNKKNSRSGYSATIARVMLSSVNGSVWVDVKDHDSLEYFSRLKKSGVYSLIGVRLQVDSDSVYGYSINPKAFVFSVPQNSVPESLKVDLNDLLGSPSSYTEKGLLEPPVWFINVKVQMIDLKTDVKDIRS
ncbi:MAG: hypothetical protein JXK07_06080 [Spirochaetes bacterium]|nr:hypothetical protein [Spirochaetota bacterium]MBN2772367.1 hypothetical protein [Spirochaetota bacterium]